MTLATLTLAAGIAPAAAPGALPQALITSKARRLKGKRKCLNASAATKGRAAMLNDVLFFMPFPIDVN